MKTPLHKTIPNLLVVVAFINLFIKDTYSTTNITKIKAVINLCLSAGRRTGNSLTIKGQNENN